MDNVRRPSAFVLMASAHGTLIVNRNDFTMMNNTPVGVGIHILEESCFDPEEVDTVLLLLRTRKQLFGKGVVGLDCGANIGVHTIEWAKLMYGWGHVMAFEPQERIFYALAGNVTINNCFNVKLFNAAVGAENSTIKVPKPDYLKNASFGSLELRKTDHNEFIGQVIDYSAEKCNTVPLLAIDSFNLNRIDFIKLDIEGMELEAIEGAKKSIEKFKPLMLTEYIKTDKEKLLTYFNSQGYKSYLMGCNLLSIHKDDPTFNHIKLEIEEATL